MLIRAAARTPNIRVKIAGIGPEESRLKMLAEQLDAVNVEFSVFCVVDDLREIRRSAKGLVIPSLMYENAPLAVLEALADGLPSHCESIWWIARDGGRRRERLPR